MWPSCGRRTSWQWPAPTWSTMGSSMRSSSAVSLTPSGRWAQVAVILGDMGTVWWPWGKSWVWGQVTTTVSPSSTPVCDSLHLPLTGASARWRNSVICSSVCHCIIYRSILYLSINIYQSICHWSINLYLPSSMYLSTYQSCIYLIIVYQSYIYLLSLYLLIYPSIHPSIIIYLSYTCLPPSYRVSFYISPINSLYFYWSYIYLSGCHLFVMY